MPRIQSDIESCDSTVDGLLELPICPPEVFPWNVLANPGAVVLVGAPIGGFLNHRLPSLYELIAFLEMLSVWIRKDGKVLEHCVNGITARRQIDSYVLPGHFALLHSLTSDFTSKDKYANGS
jgi:hypothetical protein